jgi:response regulator NasT
MTPSLRIAVADDEVDVRDYYQRILPRLGHRLVGAARTGRELVELCRAQHPDLVITDIKMPDMDGIDAAAAICRDEPVPVILVSAYHRPQLFERANADQILAYLVKPTKQANLEAAIAIAMQRFGQIQALHKEADDRRRDLEGRKLIERAKGLLMKELGLDEAEAFRRMRKQAREGNRSLIEVARMILGQVGLPRRPGQEG